MGEKVTTVAFCGYSVSGQGWVTKWEKDKDGVHRAARQVFIDYASLPDGDKMTATDVIAIAKGRYRI